MKKLVPVVFLYDFDLTLSPRNMQEYSFQDLIGMTKDEWWDNVNENYYLFGYGKSGRPKI